MKQPVKIITHAPHLSPKKSFGLGDAVEAFAKPVAKTIDRVLRTDLANCPGCKNRRDALNEAVPKIFP